MPKPLNADWNLAQMLYVEGLPYKTIAEKVGVTEVSLRQRSRRYGWLASRTTALQAVSQNVTRTLAQRSTEIRNALAEELCESADALRRTSVEGGLPHLGERADVSSKLVNSAAKVFDWEANHTPGIVIVGLTEQFDEDATPVDV